MFMLHSQYLTEQTPDPHLSDSAAKALCSSAPCSPSFLEELGRAVPKSSCAPRPDVYTSDISLC